MWCSTNPGSLYAALFLLPSAVLSLTSMLTDPPAMLMQMKRSGQALIIGARVFPCCSCCIRQSMPSLDPTAKTWSAALSTITPTQHTSA